MPGGVLRGIELIDVGRRTRRGPTAGPEIFGLHVGVAAQELHFTPTALATLVAPIRLTIGQLLAQPLDSAAQTGWVDPRGGAPRTFHTSNLVGNPVMLPQLRSCAAR